MITIKLTTELLLFGWAPTVLSWARLLHGHELWVMMAVTSLLLSRWIQMQNPGWTKGRGYRIMKACFSQIVVQSFQSFFFLKVNDFNLAAEGQRPCFSPCREFFSLCLLYMPSVSIKGSRSLIILVTGLAYHYMFLARPRSDRRISLPGLINLDTTVIVLGSLSSQWLQLIVIYIFLSLVYFIITLRSNRCYSLILLTHYIYLTLSSYISHDTIINTS